MREKERFEILLEHMDRKIDVVLESHQSLDHKIETGLEEARLDRDSMKRQMSLFVQTLSGKIDKNREGIEINREGIGKNLEGIEKNREKIEKLDEKVSLSLARYEDHEERIKVLEAVS